MMAFTNLAGIKFGMLMPIKRGKNTRAGKATWLCRCDCGNLVTVVAGNLKSGNSTNCGCLRLENATKRLTKHGSYGTHLYVVWANIKRRTENTNSPNYKYYGGRGITLCAEWVNFEPFQDWALANGYKKGLEIERIDNNGNYEPDNCRWATRKEQVNNTRKNRVIAYAGELHSLSEWAEIKGINRATLSNRINTYGWDVEKALTTPTRRCKSGV